MNLKGQSIGRYHLVEQIGQGGMAVVYRAFDTRLEREVAVKLIRMDAFPAEVHERVLGRFEREAKALARLSHTNIVQVHDYGEFEGAPYLVMEYLPGGTLKDHLSHAVPVPEAASLLAPVADALSYAHRKGVLHRDIKPSNILVTADGRPVLTDFGIAKLLEAEGKHTLTGSGVGLGTPDYMAPEQGLGGEVDGRADVYSLGVVLYELITGRKPYTADTPLAVLVKHIHDPLPRPRSLVPDLPEEAEQVLLKALAKRPEDRYEEMEGFRSVLQKLRDLPSQPLQKQPAAHRAVPPVASVPEEVTRDDLEIARSVKVHRGPADQWWKVGLASVAGLVVLGLLLVIGAGGAFLLWQWERSGGERSGSAAAASEPEVEETEALVGVAKPTGTNGPTAVPVVRATEGPSATPTLDSDVVSGIEYYAISMLDGGRLQVTFRREEGFVDLPYRLEVGTGELPCGIGTEHNRLLYCRGENPLASSVEQSIVALRVLPYSEAVFEQAVSMPSRSSGGSSGSSEPDGRY